MAKIQETQKWGRAVAKSRYGGEKAGSLPVSPAPDEQFNQFKDEKIADHVDADGWVRGKGKESPYPTFDHGDLDCRPPKKLR
jgi:hypothetical protein